MEVGRTAGLIAHSSLFGIEASALRTFYGCSAGHVLLFLSSSSGPALNVSLIP